MNEDVKSALEVAGMSAEMLVIVVTGLAPVAFCIKLVIWGISTASMAVRFYRKRKSAKSNEVIS